MLLKFTVNSQTLIKHKSQDGVTVVSDSKNYLVAKFEFLSKDWTGKVAVAQFTYDGKTYEQVIGADKTLAINECYIPNEVIYSPSFTVSCYAEGEERITTNEVCINVVKSGYKEEVVNRVTDNTSKQYQNACQKYAMLCNEILQDCQTIYKLMKEGK